MEKLEQYKNMRELLYVSLESSFSELTGKNGKLECISVIRTHVVENFKQTIEILINLDNHISELEK